MSKKLCPDCGVKPGETHMDGCDVERCPECGGQVLSCDCEWEYYTQLKYPRIPWSGQWPLEAEAIEYDFWCYWGPDNGENGWVRCDKDHPMARPNLNRVYEECIWDPEKARMVLRES